MNCTGWPKPIHWLCGMLLCLPAAPTSNLRVFLALHDLWDSGLRCSCKFLWKICSLGILYGFKMPKLCEKWRIDNFGHSTALSLTVAILSSERTPRWFTRLAPSPILPVFSNNIKNFNWITLHIFVFVQPVYKQEHHPFLCFINSFLNRINMHYSFQFLPNYSFVYEKCFSYISRPVFC